jgi:hypothetical protein
LILKFTNGEIRSKAIFHCASKCSLLTIIQQITICNFSSFSMSDDEIFVRIVPNTKRSALRPSAGAQQKSWRVFCLSPASPTTLEWFSSAAAAASHDLIESMCVSAAAHESDAAHLSLNGCNLPAYFLFRQENAIAIALTCGSGFDSRASFCFEDEFIARGE